jgi:hypothetical protein
MVSKLFELRRCRDQIVRAHVLPTEQLALAQSSRKTRGHEPRFMDQRRDGGSRVKFLAASSSR